jgi:hypothetical protein
VAASLSPFAGGAIDVRLTTLFGHDKDAGSSVRTLTIRWRLRPFLLSRTPP